MKIKLLRGNTYVPTYGTEGAAAFDIYIPEDVIIKACTFCNKVPLGIAVELPKGTCLILCARSSLGTKSMLRVSNAIGVIDSDYRGEINVVIDNIGLRDAELKQGERICQGIITPIIQEQFDIVDELSETVRGSGGFGSTGK